MSQRTTALAKGDAIRLDNAEKRRAIRAGELSPLTVVRDEQSPMKLGYLLTSIPRVGPTTANSWMEILGISNPATRVRDLSETQRRQLVGLISNTKRYAGWRFADA